MFKFSEHYKRNLTEKEVSEIYNISLGKLQNDRWLGKGIPYIKIGRKVLYRIEDIEAYIDANRIDPSTTLSNN